MHLRMKDTKTEGRDVAYLHFVEALRNSSPSERQIMDALSTSQMIQFGPLNFCPTKG